jgi:NYN domain
MRALGHVIAIEAVQPETKRNMDKTSGYRTVRTAIFVDFDNMFGGLAAMDPAAAESFATDPGRLLAWLERGEDLEGSFRRRFLLKACYLNPDAFRRYRSFFVSAGFRVIDCPSLTQKGKSAADIHLVLDVVDTLEHKTRFEEFIICSSDADFTPLMVKLRAHDRRTVMVAAGPAAAAYQSVCDETVTPIQIVEAFAKEQSVSTAVDNPSLEAGQDMEDLTAESLPPLLDEKEIETAAAAVRSAVEGADGALRGATAAGAAIRVVPRIASMRWGNPDGFAGFVSRYLPGFTLVRTDSGGWLIDTARRSEDEFLENSQPDSLPARVSRVTKAPRLSSEQYATLFDELSVLSRQPPSLNRMGAEIRERAAALGVAVPRSAANFVIQGLIYAGADPRKGERSAKEFGKQWRDAVLHLCERADLEINSADEEEIEAWLLGGLSPSD